MWNNSSLVMDDNLTTTMTKWTTPSSKEDEEEDQPPEVPFRSWTTHYADWNLQNGCGGDEHLPDYLFHQSTNADQLFRQFVGDEGADRMEFYVNHLTMDPSTAGGLCTTLAESLLMTTTDQDRGGSDDDASAVDDYRPVFPLLDTILEETSEDLLNEDELQQSDSSPSSSTSSSGRWGWGWGWIDDDSSSVIHCPLKNPRPEQGTAQGSHDPFADLSHVVGADAAAAQEAEEEDLDLDLTDDDECWSERDQEVPKKRRRIVTAGSSTSDPSPASSRSPSVTESLIQFEALEKELIAGSDAETIQPVFRTSATSAPFEDSPDEPPEVFLDCQEHPEVVVSGQLASESSSDASYNSLEVVAAPIQQQQQKPRKWSSTGNLNGKDDDALPKRSHSSDNLIPTTDDVVGGTLPDLVQQEEDEEEEEDWEPDGFLHSSAGSSSEEYETSDHSGEADDEFNFAFLPRGGSSSSHSARRMHSFRSYGDNLNLLEDEDDPVRSSSPSCSGSSPDARSSPERGSSSLLLRRSSRSAEVLSEDSGYGEHHNMSRALMPSCPPDVGPDVMEEEETTRLNNKTSKRRPPPLSLEEAEEFVLSISEEGHPLGDAALPEAPGGLSRSNAAPEEQCLEGLECQMSHTSNLPGLGLENGRITTALLVGTDDDIRCVPLPLGTDLDASKINWPGGDGLVPHLAGGGGSCYREEDSEAESDEQKLADADQNVTCPILSSDEMESSASVFYPAPVVLKRYGPRQEVEVYITSSSGQDLEKIPAGDLPAIRGVHFSPVVSAVNWRESYLDQSEDEEEEDGEDASTVEADAAAASASSPSAETDLQEEAKVQKVRVELSPSAGMTVHKVVLSQDSPVVVSSGPVDGADAAAPLAVAEQPLQPSSPGNNNKKKSDGLFQRFSLARLSARMSATFARSDSKRASGKSNKKNAKDAVHPIPEASSAPPVEPSVESNKKGAEPDEPVVSAKKKMRFFIGRPFQRSASTPPEAIRRAEKAKQEAKLAKEVSPSPEQAPLHPVNEQPVAQQTTTGTSTASALSPPTPPARHRSASPQSSPSPMADPSADIPTPKARTLPPSSKPPLPPQIKPRILARKNYLVQQQQQQPSQHEPPPVPTVTSAGLQLALQHFAETARMERERLANSVPDLLASPPAAPPIPARPTSDCIDRSNSPTTPAQPSSSRQAPSLPPRHPSTSSRERARQAALCRASSVETAWNATAERAILNLSRRNLSASGEALPAASAAKTPSQGHAVQPRKPGLLETNLDSVLDECGQQRRSSPDETNLDELILNLQRFRAEFYTQGPIPGAPAGGGNSAVDHGGATSGGGAPLQSNSSDKRFKSMLNLGSSSAPVSVQPDINNSSMLDQGSAGSSGGEPNSRAKSMEFLLDEDNKSAVQVPENQLKKCGERQMSEHELRIQRSLQKLNVPEWYKSNARKPIGGTDILSRRRTYGQQQPNGTGWAGLSSATTASSMTSLGSLAGYSNSRSGTPTRVVIPTRVRPDWRNVKSSRESLLSPAGSESSQQPQFGRWGSGRSYTSGSACPSPSPSTFSSSYRSSLLSQHGRQPYLGWRSQDKLNQAGQQAGQQQSLPHYPTPAERLASSIPKKPTSPTNHQSTGAEVDEQIRQVTSAIVHYVKDGGEEAKNGPSEKTRHPLEALSRSPSPRRQRCVWVESSFVGGPDRAVLNNHHNTSGASSSSYSPSPSPTPSPAFRPDSPAKQQTNHRAKGLTESGRPAMAIVATIEPVPARHHHHHHQSGPATLDDVLNSLLGLAPPPPAQPMRRPVIQPPVHPADHDDISSASSR